MKKPKRVPTLLSPKLLVYNKFKARQNTVKYSDEFVDWLVDEGYSHCFFVAGGNIMHLLDSVRSRMTCVPFVNEIGAAIAAEYFTASRPIGSGKAFVLVTAGPGLTNTITAIASAWVESRELLIVGGQVKSSDLSRGEVRQRGIQEIGGLDLVSSICKQVLAVEKPLPASEVIPVIRDGYSDRKGPIFIEMCLDAQAAPATQTSPPAPETVNQTTASSEQIGLLENVSALIKTSQRPVFLLGQGVNREFLRGADDKLQKMNIPVLTTWNGADLLPSDHRLYWGRPDTWGQRSANLLIQQADLIIAVGSRLGVQQTGFAWQEFGPVATIVQVDIDPSELTKGHPRVDFPINLDSTIFLSNLFEMEFPETKWDEWIEFGTLVREQIPLDDPNNITAPGYINPYELLSSIANIAGPDDILIPCSSGAAYSCSMQSLQQRENQRIVTNKGMASMGYGLSGAIGASLANTLQRTFLFEGDGGFAQNLQELGTAAINNLNLKMFIFANDGYASIRTTQRNYFDGAWIGCDKSTFLGLPELEKLANVYDIPYVKLNENFIEQQELFQALKQTGPVLIEVPIDPKQTYLPKITSSVQSDGSMKSNPLHLMDPPLAEESINKFLKYLKN